MTPISSTPPRRPPVAVIGMSCRLPAAANLDEFRRAPHRTAAFEPTAYEPTGAPRLDGVDLFDSAWFDLPDAEAAVLDPRQRLALEAVVEAIDDAGIGYRVRGSGAAVIVAVGAAQGYEYRRGRSGGDIAQGVAHVLGLHGPSTMLEISTGAPEWADAAARAFDDVSVPFVIVAGVDVEVAAATSSVAGGEPPAYAPPAAEFPWAAGHIGRGATAVSRAGNTAISPDGPVSEFRRRAGCGVLVLQRLADAVRTGSQVRAEIDFSLSDSPCATAGLSASPNISPTSADSHQAGGSHQEYEPPAGRSDTAHGSMPATRSVMAVIERVCALTDGSATRTADGLSIRHACDPGTPEPSIQTTCTWEPGTPTTRTPEPGTPAGDTFRPARSTTSTPESGTPATRTPEPGTWSERSSPAPHQSDTRESGSDTRALPWSEPHTPLVVRPARVGRAVRPMDPPVLITVSGRDDTEFKNAAMRLVQHLRFAAPAGDRAAESAALHELSAATTRSIPKQTRGAVLAGDTVQAQERLRALAQGESGSGIVGPRTSRRRDGVLFLFTGTADRPARSGRALAARYPVFAAALNEITDAVVTAGGPRIWTPRFGFHPPATGRAEQELGLLAGFVHQVALARLVEHWGIRADAVCGYGFGELAAAAVAGVLTTADAARLAVRRAGAHDASTPDGQLSASVSASPEEVARLIEPLRPAVTLAAVHGPRSVLVRGELRRLETLVRRAERRGLSATIIDHPDHPGPDHSPDAVPAGAQLRAGFERAGRSPEQAGSDAGTAGLGGRADGACGRLDGPWQLGLATQRLPFYSTVRTGQVFSAGAPAPHYWTEDVSGPVQLAAAMDRAARDGVGTVLEFAAHPVLTPALREYPQFRDSVHPVGDRDDEVAALLLALAELHTDGRFVEWSGQGPFTVAGPRRRWRRTPVRSPLPLVTDCAAAAVDAGEHALGTIASVPTGYWVRTLLRLAAPAELMADFMVHDRLGPEALGAIECRDDGPAGLRVYLGDVPVVSARPLSGPTPADIVDWMRVVDTGRSARHRMRELGGANFYAMLRRHRLEYGPRRRVLGRVEIGVGHAYGTVETVAANLVSVIEGCVHLLVAAAKEFLSERTWPSVPAISTVWVGASADRLITHAYATVRERGPDRLVGDVVGTDDEGVPVLALSGVRIVFAERDAANEDEHAEMAPFRAQVWLPVSTGAQTPAPARLRRLLVVGASDSAARLARATDLSVPTEHVATTPDTAGEAVWAAAEAGVPPTGIVLIWPDGDDPDPAAALARAHAVLTRAATATGTAGLTVVLPRRALRGSGGAAIAWGVAALTRTLGLESRRRVRVVWADTDPRALGLLADLVTIDAPTGRRPQMPVIDTPAAEGGRTGDLTASEVGAEVIWSGDLRLGADGLTVRRFRQAPALTSPAPRVDPEGTYVVTGGLGRRGAVAVRWLLDAGAHDVVVLTRDPRPVPGPLDGLEDRFVVVRCDVTDRSELAGALDDIREYGSTIRGVVHAAEDFEAAGFAAVTADQLSRLFAPKATAARYLLELTAADPIDFMLLFSSTAGALGARNQAAYAAASAAVDALAAGARRARVLALGWEIRQSDTAPAITDDDPARVARGARLLTQALRSGLTHLLVDGETAAED